MMAQAAVNGAAEQLPTGSGPQGAGGPQAPQDITSKITSNTAPATTGPATS